MLIAPHYYLSLLVVSLVGLLWLDYRLKLAVFVIPKKTLKILLITVGVFMLWDIAGIVLGIFQTNPDFVLGINLLTPNMPIEEPLLLILITYITLLIAQILERRDI